MESEKARLREKRRRDWWKLVEKREVTPPDQSAFPVDGDGTQKVALGPLLRCSQRELEWLYEEPVTVVLSRATAITEVVARYDESGIQQPFLPTILRVRYVGRIYLAKEKDDAPRVVYLSYEDGTGRFDQGVMLGMV
jgi:hypothetical protein